MIDIILDGENPIGGSPILFLAMDAPAASASYPQRGQRSGAEKAEAVSGQPTPIQATAVAPLPLVRSRSRESLEAESVNKSRGDSKPRKDGSQTHRETVAPERPHRKKDAAKPRAEKGSKKGTKSKGGKSPKSRTAQPTPQVTHEDPTPGEEEEFYEDLPEEDDD